MPFGANVAVRPALNFQLTGKSPATRAGTSAPVAFARLRKGMWLHPNAASTRADTTHCSFFTLAERSALSKPHSVANPRCSHRERVALIVLQSIALVQCDSIILDYKNFLRRTKVEPEPVTERECGIDVAVERLEGKAVSVAPEIAVVVHAGGSFQHLVKSITAADVEGDSSVVEFHVCIALGAAVRTAGRITVVRERHVHVTDGNPDRSLVLDRFLDGSPVLNGCAREVPGRAGTPVVDAVCRERSSST